MRFVSIKTLATSAAAITLAALSAFSVTACDELGVDDVNQAQVTAADEDEAPDLEEAGLAVTTEVATRNAGAVIVSADTYHIASMCGSRGTLMTHEQYDCCLDSGCTVKHDYYTSSLGQQCEDTSCDCGLGSAAAKPGEASAADLNDMAYVSCLQN